MTTAKRECRVCGKMYDYCHTEAFGKFRWQDVACSPECGEKYFAAIRISRGESLPKDVEVEEPKEEMKEPISEKVRYSGKRTKAHNKPAYNKELPAEEEVDAE